MGLVSVAGRGLYLPSMPRMGGLPPGNNAITLNATGHQAIFCGAFWHKDYSNKSIRRVGLRWGAITKSGGSGLVLSLQDVSLTAGGPPRHDGTRDQSVAIANGDAGFATGLYYMTGLLDANRSITPGDLVAVVLEFDANGRLGSDSVAVVGMSAVETGSQHLPSTTFYNGSTYAAQSIIPNIIFECTDGSFGTLDNCHPWSALSSVVYNNTSNPDEYCLEWVQPFPCKVDSLWSIIALNGDVDFVLYSGTTPMVTVSQDANASQGFTARRIDRNFTPTELTAGTTYRLAVKPTSASNVTLYYFDVADANHLQTIDGGVNAVINSRVDAGAWGSPTTTRRPWMGLRISHLHDGAGGGLARIIGG